MKDAVRAEKTDPLQLKGKADSIHAFRVLQVLPTEPLSRRLESAMIGRDREMALAGAFLVASVVLAGQARRDWRIH